eukprot:548863-Prorocentrum_minimum.AAC.4
MTANLAALHGSKLSTVSAAKDTMKVADRERHFIKGKHTPASRACKASFSWCARCRAATTAASATICAS